MVATCAEGESPPKDTAAVWVPIDPSPYLPAGKAPPVVQPDPLYSSLFVKIVPPGASRPPPIVTGKQVGLYQQEDMD